MRKSIYLIAALGFMGLAAGGCGSGLLSEESTETETMKEQEDIQAESDPEEETEYLSGGTAESGSVTEEEPEILHFVDVYGEEYQVEINPNVKKHDYDLSAFSHEGNRMIYQGDERYTYRLGIDVSHHQGEIDWEKVKAAGYEFAFLRIGYRGYGQEGKVCQDSRFFQNIENAHAAGIDVGVYFFSQAVNEDEAREEAEFVLKNLKGQRLELPVVYDPESILDADARTDHVTGEQFTKNTLVFHEMIKEAGYSCMIYSNMLWEAYQYDLEQLWEYPIWYADYEPLPQTPYHFEFLQYTNTANIDGVSGVVDLNIQLIPAERKGEEE